jgi:GNAT superfamily N-acetyltransferase
MSGLSPCPRTTRADMGHPFLVRAASPSDADAVGVLLRASYALLLAPGYEPEMLARALPLMTKANPALLSSGTWYVAQAPGADGALAGCGGWTLQRPGAPYEPVDPALGHLRHFAVHPGWTRMGVGRALCSRCTADARAVGVHAFECYATTVAETFYRALGFETVGPLAVPMTNDIDLPSIRMICRIAVPGR